MNRNKKYQIVDGAFYITNVCNLTCDNCESYNNLKFKGHFYWEDHKEKYLRWKEILNIRWLNIHGGEPLTNPDLLTWAINLKSLWTNAERYYISTNGTTLKHNIDLSKELIKLGWSIYITIHDPSHKEMVEESIISILDDGRYYVDNYKESKIYKDKETGKILINFESAFYFIRNSTKFIKDGVIHMHRNDVEKAHALCISAASHQCHFFVRGNLYKCFLTAISEDLMNQFKIEPFAQEMLSSYRYADPFDDFEILDNFFINLQNAIGQCTLCPTNEIKIQIFPLQVKKNSSL